MRIVKRGLAVMPVVIATIVIALLGTSVVAAAQVVTTTIQDTVYRADGTPASGTVVVSWPTFTTAAGQAVAAGNTSATIGANGALTMALTPNAGAMPTGSYYTAVLHLDDGTTSQQYWVVPVSSTPVTLAAIENQVLPASVAMQTASRAYVDAKIAQVTTGGSTSTGSYVPTTGGTMTGPLVLPADPITPNQAADKHYVDTNITQVTAGMGQKVSLVPTVTQTIAQPTGTQLQVNALNGSLYASQFQAPDGGSGLANALTQCPATGSCLVTVDPSYLYNESLNPAQIPNGGHVVDLRNGADFETFVNPVNGSGGSTSLSLGQITTNTDANSAVVGGGVGSSRITFTLSNTALAGGSNQLPGNIENPPYGKANYGVTQETGNYFTEGQHVQNEHIINCYAVGDCLEGSWMLTSSGGYRDMADEGTHPFDLQVQEDWRVFEGTCATGCTTGATQLMVNATFAGGTQGEGRYLIDKNPAKTITTGQIVSAGFSQLATVNFTGTNFPASVLLQTTAAATSQPKNIAPGTVTLPIATSNVPAGFASNTSQLPSNSGVACVADTDDSRFPNFETANYTVVDASHITLTLNKVHGSGAVIAVGGICGYGIEQTVDTVGGVRQVFPVVGTASPTSLYYAAASTPILGLLNAPSTSGFQNISVQISSLARKSNVVTATLASNLPVDVNGLTMTISGAADASYNGSFQVASQAANIITYTATGPDSTTTGGTLTFLNGGYVLYPMAEVLSVYDASAKQIDGQFTVAPNTVAWAPGDAVEEPHYYQQLTAADTEWITQYVPRPLQYSSAGKQYMGEVGPGMRGWEVQNAVPASNYLGAGGTRSLPDYAYVAAGPWQSDFDLDAGTNSVFNINCNLHGCNRWDSGYNLFTLQSATGYDGLFYSPQVSTELLSLGGQTYTFSPSKFIVPVPLSVGSANQFTVDGSGNVAAGNVAAGNVTAGNVTATTVNLTGGASGSNYDLKIADGSSNQLYIGTTNPSDYAVLYFGTPSQTWQFALGGQNTGTLANEWYLFDQTNHKAAMQVASGTEAVNFNGSVTAAQYMGPATAPSGSCSTNGAWVFSQDGHATFCSAGTWVTKI